jgi:hypothetical protein
MLQAPVRQARMSPCQPGQHKEPSTIPGEAHLVSPVGVNKLVDSFTQGSSGHLARTGDYSASKAALSHVTSGLRSRPSGDLPAYPSRLTASDTSERSRIIRRRLVRAAPRSSSAIWSRLRASSSSATSRELSLR